MSLSYYEGLKPVKLPDPRIDIKTQNKYLFKQPANVVTYKTFNSNSTSQNSTHFTATPPNPNIVISPLVYVSLPVDVTIAANNAGDALGLSATEAFTEPKKIIVPRQLPISSIIATLSLKLNTDTTTVNLNDYIHALSRFYSDDAIRAYEMSSSPVQPDFFQKYEDEGTVAGGIPLNKESGLNLGSNRSVFSSYGSNTNESSRGSYLPSSLTYEQPAAGAANGANGITKAHYDFDEPLFISPLSSGDYSKMGLIQIQTFDLDITWDSKLERILSVNKTAFDAKIQPARLASFTVSLGDPKLKFIYMTPHINYPIPETVIYEFSEINRITKNIGLIEGWNPVRPAAPAAGAAGTTVSYPFPVNGKEETITSDNIQLSSIPNKVYIYVRRNNNTRDKFTSDAFCRIKKINIDFNGVSGILASASEHDLWRMSCDSGLRVSWDAWRFYGGSVLCIDFGKNIGLSPQQGVGMLGTYNFSYQLTFQNINTQDMAVEMYTLVESVGTMTIQNQQVIKQIGILTSKDAIEAPDVSQADAKLVENLYGGSFMSGMKNLYSNTKSFARKGKKFMDDNPKMMEGLKNAGKTVGKVAATTLPLLLGLGYTKKQINEMAAAGYTDKDFKKLVKTMQGAPVGRGGNMLMGGGPVGGAGRVGFPTGGAMLPKTKLANRVRYEY